MKIGDRFQIPTIELLLEIPGVSAATAQTIRGVLEGAIDPCEVSPKCKRWVNACYNRPDTSKHEAKLIACDDLLQNHGVESVPFGESHLPVTDEGIRMCPPFSYSNTGDSYALTIVRDHSAGAWGDWHAKVPKGMVAIVAKIDGRDGTGPERFFLVASEEYQHRNGVFVVPDNAQEIEAL